MTWDRLPSVMKQPNDERLMMDFEWDDAKNASNIGKHGINFEGAIVIFDGPVLLIPSPRHDEHRWLAIGMVGEVEIAVIYTERGAVKRLISARRARKNERTAYRQAFWS